MHQMPSSLTAREIPDGAAVEYRALFEFDPNQMAIPLRHLHQDVAFNCIGCTREEGPVASYRRRALIVPHADSGARSMAKYTQWMGIDAGNDALVPAALRLRRLDFTGGQRWKPQSSVCC